MAADNMNNVQVSQDVLWTLLLLQQGNYINCNSKFYITPPEETIVQRRSKTAIKTYAEFTGIHLRGVSFE